MALSITTTLSEAYEHLNPRERVVVTAGGVIAVIIILSMGWLLLSQGVETIELQKTTKMKQLEQLVNLQSTYSQREAQSRQLKNRLKGNNIRLVSHVENAAKESGLEIGNMTPKDSSPDPDGIMETSVLIKVQKVSITRLQDFIERLERVSQGVVVIKRIKANKRFYDKSLLDVEISVSTYKIS